MDKLEPREIDYAKQKRKSIAAWTVAIIFACFQLVITLAPFIFMVLNSYAAAGRLSPSRPVVWAELY